MVVKRNLSGVCFSATAVRKTAWRRRVAAEPRCCRNRSRPLRGGLSPAAGSGSVAGGFRRRPKKTLAEVSSGGYECQEAVSCSGSGTEESRRQTIARSAAASPCRSRSGLRKRTSPERRQRTRSVRKIPGATPLPGVGMRSAASSPRSAMSRIASRIAAKPVRVPGTPGPSLRHKYRSCGPAPSGTAGGEHRRHAAFGLGRQHPAGVIAHDNESANVRRRRRPSSKALCEATSVGVHADRREFVLEERRVVGEFGLPQSRPARGPPHG